MSSRLSRILWALTLVTLPVTSFRYLPFLGTGTFVRPLAIYPLLLLFPVLLARLYRKEIPRPWPGALTILAAFTLAALGATAFGATLAPIELRGVTYADRALRAFVTLGLGLAFFIAAIWMNQDEEDLKFSARWLLVGLAAHVAWGLVQFWGLNSGKRQLLTQIQQLFSARGLVKNKRISGFAFEPSWLAGQIVTLYLPWLTGWLLFRFKNSLFTKHSRAWPEALLLLGALTALLMTYSRSGLLVTALAAGVTLTVAGGALVRKLFGWFLAGFRSSGLKSRRAAIQTAAGRVLLILIAVSVLAGAGAFLADKGYIAVFFKSEAENWQEYAASVYLGPRLAYVGAALEAYQAHPLSGVGLGASGFWIYQNLPDWVLFNAPEVAEQLSPTATQFPNPKNLYARLLAETGLIGFALFLAFYLHLLADALEALRKQPWLGAAGLFALTAIVLQGLSQDSFAMPELWLNLGILAGVTGAWRSKA